MKAFSFFAVIFLVGIIILQGFFASAAHADTADGQNPTIPFVFLRDLHEGDSGNDVLELQKLLNTDEVTQVSTGGIGSPGNETEYFGKATKSAAIRFQNKYSDEVLRPAGLASGTGFVGLWSRLKLNQILLKGSVAQMPVQPVAPGTPTNPTSPAITLTSPLPSSLTQLSGLGQSGEPTISGLSSYAAQPGAQIAISGFGFAQQSNTIHLGSSYSIGNNIPQSANQIVFTVPSSLAPGRYDVYFSAGGKDSNHFPFMITVPGANPPTVEKIEPTVATFGQQIKITGQNFSTADNIVSTNLGVVKNLASSDGKTITFTIPLPDYLKNGTADQRKAWFGTKDNLNWPVTIRVININGISANTDSGKFIINI